MKTRVLFILALLCSLGTGAKGVGPAPTPDENPQGDTGALKSQVQTGGSYDAHSGNATRMVTDLHVPGALGDYGLNFTRYWNSVHNEDTNSAADWPSDFGASGWSHSWRWSAVYDEQLPEGDPPPTIRNYISSITVTFPDGHATKFKIARTNAGSHPDPRAGPPYYAAWGERDWPTPGREVHDNLAEMAQDGSEFWLYRADGGAVHFVGFHAEYGTGHAWWSYRATEVFDPHGFRTELNYTDNLLTEVKQEGNRSLNIIWKSFTGYTAPVIGRVETGGVATGQHVTYKYTRFPYQSQNPAFYVLAVVAYPNDPVPGQTNTAVYTYGSSYGNDPNSGPQSYFPLLKTADDPRYAGAMTKIRYNYYGDSCEPTTQPDPNPPEGFYNWHYFTAEAIAEERSSETNTVVARFEAACETGVRNDYNGLGGWRTFYFGSSANEPEILAHVGYQLTKITDFAKENTPTSGVPSRKQSGPEPGVVWDGWETKTFLDYDDSGSPSAIHYVDQSHRFYDRLDSNGSASPDPARMHNQQHHWLFKKTDEREQITRYRRDARRRVTRIEYPDNSYETFEYDNGDPNGLGQVTSHRLPSEAVETYEYDPSTHLLMREYNSVDGWAARKEYTYYGPGNHPEWTGLVETMTDGRARVSPGALFSVKMTYNGRHKVTSVEYPPTGGMSNPTVRYEYDNYGNCTAITNELSHRSTYTYDSYRRCTSYTEQLDGTALSRTWNWIYDRVIDYGNNVQAGFPPSAHISSEWRVQIEPVFNENNERRQTARWFDVNNRMTLEQSGWIQGPQGNWYHSPDIETHRFTYDQNGQKSSFTDPRSRVTTYEYDNRNRLWKTTEYPMLGSGGTPRTTQTFYNAAGDKIKVIFPDGEMQQWPDYAYDAFGQPRIFIDERDHTTNMDYRPWGPMKKLAQVTTHRTNDAGQVEHQLTAFFPDLMGRPWRTTFPDGSYEESTYEFGQLKEWRNRRGGKKVIDQYDARGREKHHYWLKHDGITVDSSTPAVTRLWDDANRLTSIANVWSTIEYGYDDAGQAKWERSNVVGAYGPAQVNYLRYPSGEVSWLTYPNQTSVQRFYTARGQLKDVGWGAGATSYVYHPDGKVNFQARTNGVTTTYEYNGRGMISSIAHKNGSNQSLAYREYHWRDERDRIVAWKRGTDNSQNGMEDGRGDRYKYDDEGQLERAWYRAMNPELEEPDDPKRGDEFQYDELGNRFGENRVASRGVLNFERKNNRLNQYRGWWPYSIINYDEDEGGVWGSPGEANGVLMEDGYITAGFNALNQPTGIWSKVYPGGASAQWMWLGYDPLGRCVKRWKSTASVWTPGHNPATYFYYDGWNLIQEGPSGATADRVYVHGGRVDEIVASAGSQWYNHHYDARGHCLLLTSSTGTLLEQYDYDAFGYPYFYNAAGAKQGQLICDNRFLFTGREWLRDHRIYDYRNRMYQPELGRFLQPDPTHFAAGDYNLYRYCHNDPVNKSDPTGLYWDVQDFNHADNWKIWQMISKVEKMPGPLGETFRQLSNSPNRIVVIPIQNTPEGQTKWNVPPRAQGDHTNRTTPQNEADAENGAGSGSRVEFDPNNSKDSAGNNRAPIEGIVHEGRHAAANDKGERLPGSKQEEDRAREFQKLFRRELEKGKHP